MYTDCDSKCHIQAYANCDAYSYSYTYEYAQRYANCNSHGYLHSDTNTKQLLTRPHLRQRQLPQRHRRLRPPELQALHPSLIQH
jgi:hypothetical protein